MTTPGLFDLHNPEPAPAGAPATRVEWDRECPLPVAPSASVVARHNSATGAQYAAQRRGELTEQYTRLLRNLGPASDHEAAGMLGVGLSSINSTRAKLGVRVVEATGHDEVRHWPNGRLTRRTRWRLATRVELEAQP